MAAPPAGAPAESDAAQAGKMTGRYELIGVATHKGRSIDGGHYIGWTRQRDGSWVQFDDDTLIPRKDEDIIQLCGGGDWHTAYLMLYRAQRVPADTGEATSAPPVAAAAAAPGEATDTTA
jgi:ubiquitin carboxyl-terminal hydrolase 14